MQTLTPLISQIIPTGERHDTSGLSF